MKKLIGSLIDMWLWTALFITTVKLLYVKHMGKVKQEPLVHDNSQEVLILSRILQNSASQELSRRGSRNTAESQKTHIPSHHGAVVHRAQCHTASWTVTTGLCSVSLFAGTGPVSGVLAHVPRRWRVNMQMFRGF